MVAKIRRWDVQMKRQWKGFVSGIMVTLLLVGLIGTAVAAGYQKQATLDYTGIKITLDGKEITPTDANGAAVEPFAISGTTYLPVRAVANAFGLEVGWDQDTSTVTLDTPQIKKPTYITRTGSKYHNDPTCNGGTYWEVPYSTAIGMGLEPCDKCVH